MKATGLSPIKLIWNDAARSHFAHDNRGIVQMQQKLTVISIENCGGKMIL